MESSLKNKVVSGMIWRFSGRIIAQLVTFLVSIILARLLSPENYGIVSLTTIFITIANVFVVDGFGKALIQKKDVDNIDYSTVFYCNLLFSFLLYIFIYFIAPIISDFYGEELIIPTLRVLALRIPLSAINSVQQAYVSRNMLFKRFFWSTLFGTVLSAIVGVYMAFNGYGVWALVGQYLTNNIVDTIILWFTVKWRPQLVFKVDRIKHLSKFGFHILFTSLFTTFYDNLRSLLVGRVYNTVDLAYYNRGIQYPNLIIVNVNTTIGSVLYPVFSKLQDDRKKLKNSLRKSISLSSYIIFPLMFGLFAIAPDIVKFMLTDKWLPSVPFLRIACVYFSLYPINTVNLQALIAIGESKLYFKLTILKKIIGIILLFISIPFGVLFMAASEIISGIIAVILNVRANKELLNYEFKELFIDIKTSLFLTTVMTSTVMLLSKNINLLFNNIIVIIIIKIVVGALTYIGGSVFMKSQEFTLIFGILKQYLLKNKNK